MIKKIVIAIIAIALAVGAFTVGATLDSSAQSIDARRLVDLLIALGFIPQEKADAARAAVSLKGEEPVGASQLATSTPVKAFRFVPRIDSISSTAASPGEVVTLSGIGFDSPSKVYIGEAPYDPLVGAGATAEAGRSLSFLIPDRPGPHKVFVANANGTSSAVAITIVPVGSSKTYSQACGGTEPPTNLYTYKGPGTYAVGTSDAPVWTFGIPLGGGSEACRFMCVNKGVYDGKGCSAGPGL